MRGFCLLFESTALHSHSLTQCFLSFLDVSPDLFFPFRHLLSPLLICHYHVEHQPITLNVKDKPTVGEVHSHESNSGLMGPSSL